MGNQLGTDLNRDDPPLQEVVESGTEASSVSTQTAETSTVDRGTQAIIISPRDLVRLEDKLKQKSEITDKKIDYITWLKRKMDDKDAEIRKLREEINTMQWQFDEQNNYYRTTVESLQFKLGWWEKKQMNDEEKRRREIEEQRHKEKETLEIKARVRIEEEERVRVKRELESKDNLFAIKRQRL